METSRGIIAALAIGVVAFAIDYSLVEQALFSPGASTLALVLGALAAIWVSDVESGGKWMTKAARPYRFTDEALWQPSLPCTR